MAFNASRIREETRPWPKYESQGAVESEDQLLFFAGGNKKAASEGCYHQRPKTPKAARPLSYRSLVFYFFGLGAFAKADTKPDIYISVTPIFTS